MAFLNFVYLLVTQKKPGRGLLLLSAFLILPSLFAKPVDKLRLKYPNCTISTDSIFLTDAQFKKLDSINPSKKVEKFYSYYKKECSQRRERIFILRDQIRTQYQFVLFKFNDLELNTIEVIKFDEPHEYKVSPKWLNKLLKEDIDGVSGATLTSISSLYLKKLTIGLNSLAK